LGVIANPDYAKALREEKANAEKLDK